jgi:hypothetical protein
MKILEIGVDDLPLNERALKLVRRISVNGANIRVILHLFFLD